MNRRNFIKASVIGSISLTGLVNGVELNRSKVTYKDFDWVDRPVSYLFRMEKYNDNYGGELRLVSIPVCCKILRCKSVSDIGVDWTEEVLEEKGHKYYTNEILLTEAKRNGYTHLYKFDSICYDGIRIYYLYGVKKENWKRVNGKIRIVEK
jgi:hypothetical protein